MFPDQAGLGLYSNIVRLADPDQRWSGHYQSEAQRVAAALTEFKPLIEHIGSTAVPNLLAKPIIDYMIGIDTEGQFPVVIKAMDNLGYVCHGEKGLPGRMFLTLGEPRTHHAHLVIKSGEFWAEHILFRDYLVAHPSIAGEYAATKLELARKYPTDRDAYTDGKTDFIRSVLDRATRWKTKSES